MTLAKWYIFSLEIMSGNYIRFKRAEIVQFLASERVFGDAVALQVDMDFVKDPKSNLDTMLQCYLSGLEKLGFKVENLHQPPAQAALSVRIYLLKLLLSPLFLAKPLNIPNVRR